MQEDVVRWLLEPENPAVRFLMLRDVLRLPAESTDVAEARRAVSSYRPVRDILDAQFPAGYWVKPGPGYSPKYRSTVWQVIFLAQMGMTEGSAQVRNACEYVLTHAQSASGGFGASGVRDSSSPPPERVLHCLNGNLVHALLRLGHEDDPRVHNALQWQTDAATGLGDIRYYSQGTSGPLFACGVNGGLPCAWGAIKALSGFARLPAHQWTPRVEHAVQAGIDLLLSCDPVSADYPSGTGRKSPIWLRLGFPSTYAADVLQIAEVLAELGYGQDSRLDHVFDWLLAQRDVQGRWPNRNACRNRLWSNIDRQGAPSKWVSMRALRALTLAGRLAVPKNTDDVASDRRNA